MLNFCTAFTCVINTSPPKAQHCIWGMLGSGGSLLMTKAICQYIPHDTYGHTSAL